MGFIASVSVLLAGVVWGLRLLAAPGPLADGSAALVAISMVVAAATASLGLVLSRGRWSRRLAFGTLASQVGLALFMDLNPWGWAALAATAASLVLVAGPWLDGFLRQLPPAEPLPLPALGLATGLIILPGLLGISSPGGVSVAHWIAGITAVATAWAFARALRVGLWSTRLVMPILLVVAGTASSLPGLIVAFLGAAAVSLLAWSPSASRAVSPLIQSGGGVAVPPELVPPDLLARAGYDDRGRPIPRRR